MDSTTVPTRDWLKKAAQARSMTESSRGHGNKLAAEQAAAERLGMRWSSLRGYLEAAQVVDRITEVSPEAAQVLRDRPADIVRSIGRWSRFDLKGAVNFIREHPTAPTSAVLTAERRARQNVSKSPDIAAILETAWHSLGRECSRYFLHPVIADQLHILDRALAELSLFDAPPPNYRTPEDEYERTVGIEKIGYLPIDRLADQLNGPLDAERRKIVEAQYSHSPYWHAKYGLAAYCFLQLPRFSVVEGYRREAKSLQLRALLAAEIYPIVVLPVPSEAARTELLAGFVSLPRRLWIDKGARGPTDEVPLPDHVLDAPPHILLPGRSRGAIIVTTPETVLADLFIDNLERYRRERDGRRAMQGSKLRFGAD